MKLRDRYRLLSLWNKIGFWGAMASIAGVFISVIFSIVDTTTGEDPVIEKNQNQIKDTNNRREQSSRLYYCENAHLWGITKKMEKQLHDECKDYCRFMTSTLSNNLSQNTGLDIEQAESFLELFYGPKNRNDEILKCNYRIVGRNFENCRASVLFNIKAKDEFGEFYTQRRKIGFDFEILDLDWAEEHDDENRDYEKYTGWILSKKMDFGIISEEENRKEL